MSIGPINLEEEDEAFKKSQVDVNDTFKDLIKDLENEFSGHQITLKGFKVKTRFKFFRFWRELKLFIEFQNNEGSIEHIILYSLKGDKLLLEKSTISSIYDSKWCVVKL